MLLTGDELDAPAARAAGLVAEVFPAAADPEVQLGAWFRRSLKPLSAHALRQATRVSREASGLVAALGAPLDAAERLYLEAVVSSHDGNEGIEAFLQRRPPAWEDR
jgi:enoyl-CoA hydratase/carnithine racemase